VRARTHMVALDRFYLDALLGVVPIRVHGAEQAVRREHERLLTEWARASLGLHAHSTWVQGVQALLGVALSCGLCGAYLASDLPKSGLLLLVYWSGRMPAAGAMFVDTLVAYRALQHATVRLLSPLSAADACAAGGLLPSQPSAAHAVSVSLRGVHVRVANRELLRRVDLAIAPGEHIAVVGPSGAGKSTLASLLLGWHTPSSGELTIDGASANEAVLRALRTKTAWVDPAIQIWNDTLLSNVLYGAADSGAIQQLPEVMQRAQLGDVVESLPDGLQSKLGEAGTCVSGGQGQRVRLARALMREDARLVVLDEPFRGLPRALRQQLLASVRERFASSTLIFVSHDIRDTRDFARVLVVEDGRVVEDGAPELLLTAADSRYRALLRSDEEQTAYAPEAWRHAQLSAGTLSESA
jgi:ABC-type transport system involved in cytochrome bd biosynthesis fused ATPase/permease subunit